MLIFLLFALLRSAIDSKTVDPNYGDLQSLGRVPIQYDYKYATATHRPYQDIARLICSEPWERSRDEGYYAAGYLAIVPPPSTHANVQHIIDEMQSAWTSARSQWNTDNANDAKCNELFSSLQYYSCRTACQYDALSFAEGSILKYFDSEDALDAYLDGDDYSRRAWDPTDSANDVDGVRPVSFAIVFDDYDDWNSITYTLRGNASYFPTTEGDPVDKFTKDFNLLFFASYMKYYTYGLVNVQHWLNQIITEKVANESGASSAPSFQYGMFVMPTAGYVTDEFYEVLAGMLPFLLILAFIYPYFVITGFVVQEKASKIKEGLRMMGASISVYWLSIYLYYGVKFTVIAFLCTLISWTTNVFQFSAFVIVFLWFSLFLFTLLCSAVMFSTLFDNAKVASMVSTIFLLTLYFLSAAADSMTSTSQKVALCLSGPACFAMSSNIFSKYEEGLIGITWDTVNEKYEYLAFSTVLIMMFIDCIIYIILAMYLDRVVPSKYGQTLPPWFIFQKSFWFPNSEYFRHHAQDAEGVNAEIENVPFLEAKEYEKVDKKQKVAIQIRNLKKVFSMGFNAAPFVAVNGISLDIFEDEIFCLLGHNGAGKTTTISMLSGMLNITSGVAKIREKDVVTEMAQIRESLGVCPQHDVLWPTLSVEEHLRLFAQLKGVAADRVKDEVDAMIEAVKMNEKRDKYPTQLSGGQKRKLSLGIALIGGSKIVFLDEPTSGMDPHSRRDAWQLIRQSAKGRTIILTTHFMDEADILADRIAIMANGNIQCCGSSLFLKRLYGVGYSFTVSVNADIPIHQVRDDINELVREHVNNAQLLSTHGAELIYRLPFETSKQFPSMFRQIDEQKDKLHVDSYGISVTTLEEVFIKVGHGEHISNAVTQEQDQDFQDELKERRESTDLATLSQELENDIEMKANDDDKSQDTEQRVSLLEKQWSDFLDDARKRSLKNLFNVHVYAMLYKKWNYTKRDKRALLCQLVLPILFMTFGFALIDLDRPAVYSKLSLDMSMFDEQQTTHPIPYNSDSLSSVNPFPPLFTQLDSSVYGELLPLNGGDNGYPYEYDSATGHSLRTFGDSMLAVSDQQPYKYVSLYFPTTNGTDWLQSTQTIVAEKHIGIGANISAFHSLPIAINTACNLALQSVSSNAKITAYIQPLPTTKQQTATTQQIEALIYSTYLSFGLAFFPVGIMYNIVHEKENFAKLQLLVSGVNSIAYWIGNFIFDSITILPSCLFAIVLVFAFDAVSFTGEALLPFLLILFLYGVDIVAFTYLFSWGFNSSTKAQYITLIAYIFMGYGFSLATFIMDIFPTTQDTSKIIKHIVRFSPSYCSARAMLNLATRKIPFAGLWDPDDSPWHWEISGRLLTWMAWESVVYFTLTIIIEYLSTIPSVNALLGLVTNLPRQPMELDEDVKAEQDKLKQFVSDENEFDFNRCKDPIVITGLRKVYNTGSLMDSIRNRQRVNPERCVTAVKDLWYSVPRGQVFGFLGVNGAGKTSTLSMLCGKFSPSDGMAYINQIPISNQQACRRMIGYCPQFDAIFDLLTAREHLVVYGLIKGLSRNEIAQQAEELMDSLTLSPYADKNAGTYSGGNKRKLSVAMAMIGEPPIVFLDEPSTGMDPVSRRSMWDFISQTMHGRSVILTTHSMEECEALCHRIGIMVKGQMRCLGTSQRLKKRFGKGFQLDCNIGVEKQERLIQMLLAEFDGKVEILEKHEETIRFTIEAGGLSLADMFEKLEVIHAEIAIDGGYALSQTTLEQIFIQMASAFEHAVATQHDHDNRGDQVINVERVPGVP